MYCIVLYCIVLYCIVLYCIVLYCIVLYCIVLYCIVLYCIVLYCIVLYCIVLYCIVLYCIVLYCIVLYCIVLYCIVLYCIVLYCIVLYCIVLYCIVLYCIVLYCIVLYCIVLYCIVLYCIVLYCIVLYCIVLYCIVLYCIVLYCIVLYCIVLYCIVLYCIVLYCIVLYCIVLYCIVLYCIVLYCIVLYCIVLYCIVLYCIVLYCIVLYCIVLYCIVLYCIVLYCIVLYCIVLYCIVLYCTDPTIPQSPAPIMSCIDTNPSATSDIPSETFMNLGSRRSNRRSRKSHPSTVNQSILSSSASQPSPSSHEPTPDIPTLVPVNQSQLHEKVHDPIPMEDLLNQPESISSSLSRFISECDILPALLPQASPQTVALTSSPVSSTEISTSLLSAVNDSSRFTPPAPGPSPRRYQKDHTSHRRYQKPTAADFVSPRSSSHSPSPSPAAVQTDVNDIQPLIDGVNLPSPNQEDNPTPSQTSDSTTPSDLSLKKDAFKDKWTTAFSSDIPWSEFCSLCDEFAVESHSLALEIAAVSSPTFHRRKPLPRCNRPSGRRPAFRHRPLLSNPAEAQRIQTLYRHSKKKAARKILSPNRSPYTGSIESAESFFKETFSLRNCDIASLQDKLNDLTTSAPIDDSLFTSPTNNEIRRKLFSAANTSPGPDRVEYRHLKQVDPSCSILSLLFDHCFKRRDVPPAWKAAITVLIYKKGSTEDPSNFRPIALMSCLYKLVMGVIAKRLTSWAIDNDLVSKEQKSARPSEGCYEHTFLLQSVIADARRSHKNVFVAWLDLRNAFGSIPHSAITTTLTHIGVPLPLIEMISNSYSGATTQIRTPNGLTADIPVLSGVKQGCPLSPIIFNLTIDLILRAIKRSASHIGPAKVHDIPFSVLAYADDLVVISRKKDRLQKLLNAASSTATDLGLSFRPDKCASISLTCSNSLMNS